MIVPGTAFGAFEPPGETFRSSRSRAILSSSCSHVSKDD
jgi:hypothetical protein